MTTREIENWVDRIVMVPFLETTLPARAVKERLELYSYGNQKFDQIMVCCQHSKCTSTALPPALVKSVESKKDLRIHPGKFKNSQLIV